MPADVGLSNLARPNSAIASGLLGHRWWRHRVPCRRSVRFFAPAPSTIGVNQLQWPNFDPEPHPYSGHVEGCSRAPTEL